MTASDRPKPPAMLAASGRALWRRMHDALAAGLQFSAPGREILARACALADREAGLRELVKDGLLSVGSRGQTCLHPAVGELRLVEAQLVGLLRQVSLEDTAGRVRSPRSRRAATAARTRWDRERDELAAKREAGL